MGDIQLSMGPGPKYTQPASMQHQDHVDLGTSTKKLTPFHGGQGSALLLIDQGVLPA